MATSMAPKMDLLLKISNEINTIYDCTQLAICLKVDDNIVTRLKEETRNPPAIAFTVLKTWRRDVEGASGQMLYKVLENEPFKHLARKYKQELQPKISRKKPCPAMVQHHDGTIRGSTEGVFHDFHSDAATHQETWSETRVIDQEHGSVRPPDQPPSRSASSAENPSKPIAKCSPVTWFLLVAFVIVPLVSYATYKAAPYLQTYLQLGMSEHPTSTDHSPDSSEYHKGSSSSHPGVVDQEKVIPHVHAGGDEAVSASAKTHHGGAQKGMTEEWWLRKLKDTPGLITDLADTSLPFSGKWKDIFRRLPEVKDKAASQQKASHLPLAYHNPDNEIQQIRKFYLIQGSQKIDSDCLIKVLNDWLNDKGVHATVGHLRDVLSSKTVKLGGAAETFFEEFFTEYHDV